MHDALADQAYLYAKGIGENRDTLEKNSKLMTRAFGWAGASLVLACIMAIWISA